MADPPHPPDENAPHGRGDAPHRGDAVPKDPQHGEPHPDAVPGEPLARKLDPRDAISPLTPASLTPPPATSQGKTMPERSDFYPADNPAATAHINLLQGIINRLAGNSSSCKTWCLTLTGALLSLAGATKLPALVVFVIVPILIFRYLDSRYLAQERAYRRHYTDIVLRLSTGKYTRADVFNAIAPPNDDDVGAALKSWSVRPVYGSLIALYVAYLILWFVDWKFGCLGGFFAPPPPAPPQAILQ